MKTSIVLKKLSMTTAGIAFFAGTVGIGNAQQAVAVV